MNSQKIQRKKIDFFSYLMSLPSIVAISLICFYPMFQGMYMSFTSTRITSPDVMRFVGIDNFIKVSTDGQFLDALWFTIVYTVASTFLAYLLGLTAALMMHRKMIGKSVVRTLLLVPWVIPTVVGTTAWQWILNDQTGIVNLLLKDLGVINKSILFLASPDIAKLTVIAFCIWKTFPFMAIIILASLQSISDDIIEAAVIDGTNVFQKFFYITLPMIKRESILAIVLMIMWNFNRMDFIFLMTEGGPVDATQVTSIYSYFTAFFRGSLGYASAMSVVMMLIMTVFLIVYFKMRKGAEN